MWLSRLLARNRQADQSALSVGPPQRPCVDTENGSKSTGDHHRIAYREGAFWTNSNDQFIDNQSIKSPGFARTVAQARLGTWVFDSTRVHLS